MNETQNITEILERAVGNECQIPSLSGDGISIGTLKKENDRYKMDIYDFTPDLVRTAFSISGSTFRIFLKTDLEIAFECWNNNNNVSDSQLHLLIEETKRALKYLQASGDSRAVNSVLIDRLSRMEYTLDARNNKTISRW